MPVSGCAEPMTFPPVRVQVRGAASRARHVGRGGVMGLARPRPGQGGRRGLVRALRFFESCGNCKDSACPEPLKCALAGRDNTTRERRQGDVTTAPRAAFPTRTRTV